MSTKNKYTDPEWLKNPVAPTIEAAPELQSYDKTLYGDTEQGKAAWKAYNDALLAYNAQASTPFTFSGDAMLKDVKGKIANPTKFTYDVNSDALYQQYAEQYSRLGKLAMQDTMGQAAAMTGGYGNSYASTAGNQAYQSYLQQLNDVVPELYQMALDKHNMERQDLYNQYSMLLSEYEREYGLHSDKYNKLLDALGISSDAYYNDANMFYTEQGNKNDVIGKENSDAVSIWDVENENAWKEAEYDESMRRYINEANVAAEDNQKLLQNVASAVKDKTPTKTPTKEPKTVKPTETANTTGFINSHMTSSEFMQRGGTSKTPSLQGGGGRSYAEYKEYIAAEIEKAWGELTDAERAYLIQYYKL